MWLKNLVCVAVSFVVLLPPAMAQEARRIEGTPLVRAEETPVPPLVKYTGQLKDRMGKPLTDIVGVTFLIYKDAEGGTPIWMETQNVKPDADGSYSVMLGAGGNGLPMDLFRSGEQRWLGFQINLPGEEERARVRLVSVPFALKAADAETLGGMPLSAFVLADPMNSERRGHGGLGIPESPLRESKASAIKLPTASVDGTGTTNKLTKWTNTTGTLGDSVISDSSGKVNISSTSKPATAPALHVISDGSWGNEPIRAQSGGSFFTGARADGQQTFAINNDAGPTLNFWGYDTAWFNFMGVNESVANTRAVSFNAGHVGVGTAAPSSYQHGGTNKILEISNPGTSLHSQSHLILSTGVSSQIGSSIGSISWMQPTATSGNKGVAFISAGTQSTNPAAPAASMQFNTRSTSDTEWKERMRIDAAGNVGIGTAGPNFLLDVLSASLNTVGANIRLTRNTTNGDYGSLGFGDTTSNLVYNEIRAIRNTAGAGGFDLALMATKFGLGPAEAVRVQGSTGNVGIGTVSPELKLHVHGSLRLTGAVGGQNPDGITFPDGTKQTTACGALAFSAPGQLSTSGVHAASDAAPVQISDIHVEQQLRIEKLEAEVASLKAKLEILLRERQ